MRANKKQPMCPYCGKPMSRQDKDPLHNPFFPFCSRRCKLADLDKWFSDEYSIEQSVDELTPEQIDDIPEPEQRDH